MEATTVNRAVAEPAYEILDALPLSAGFVDRDGFVRYVNKHACEVRNVTRDQLLGKNVFDLVPPNMQELGRAILTRALAGEVVDQEMPSPREPGAWLRVILRPARDATGAVTGFVGLQMDVSDRRAAQQRERSTNELLQHVLLAAPAGIAYVDANLRYVFGNQVLADRWGVDRASLAGRSLEALFGSQFPVAEPFLRKVLAGEPVRFELNFAYPTGTRVIDVSCVPHREDGQVLGFVAVVVDVTERKRREDLLRSLQGELEARVAARTSELREANESLGAFNYMVSHDLRGPLHGIVGLLEVAVEELPESAKVRQDLEAALQSGRRMQRIIDSLLELATLGRRELKPSPVDVSAVATAHLARLARENPLRPVRVAVRPGLTVRGDPGLLEVALTNVLDNAWKFSARTPEAQIEVGSVEEAGKAWLFVRDNGVGFDPKDAERLFTPFTRLASASSFEGSGIGLATVGRIVRRHGGEIRATSEPGRGATFYIWLP